MARKSRGTLNEERFLKAAKKNRPSWLRSVRRSSPAMDMRGIDAFAKIRTPKDPVGISIPIQLKSSYGGVRDFRAARPGHIDAGVVVLAIIDNMTDEDIRTKLHAELRKLRELDPDHYEQFLRALTKHGVSKSGKRIKKLIKKQRSES